jgi:hypothetical protein
MPFVLLPVCIFDICGVISVHEWKSLTKKGVEIVDGKTPIELAVERGSINIVKWALDNDIPIPFTDELLFSLNWSKGTEMLRLFMAKYGSEFPVTQGFVQGAAANKFCAYEMTKLLLDTRGTGIAITTEFIESVICSRGSDDNVLKLLNFVLDKVEGDIVLTDNTLSTVASDTTKGEQVLQILLKKFGKQSFPVAQHILLEAAGNPKCGDKLIALFIQHFGEQLEITDELVNNAAANSTVAFSHLLRQSGPSLQISDQCLELAAEYNARSFELLLDKYADAIVISQSTVEAAARNPDSIKLLIQRHGSEIQITSDVVEIAAISHPQSLDFLLKNRSSEAKLNEDLIIAATRCNVGVFDFLLDEYEIEITEEVMKTAAQYNLDSLEILFDKRGDDIVVTEDVLLAVAMAYSTQLFLRWIEPIVSMFMGKKEAETIASITPKVCAMSAALGDESGLECFRQHVPEELRDPNWDSICRLCVAAKEGNLEVVESLMQEPIPLDTKDNLGETPLYMAAKNGHTELVKLLAHDKRVNVNSLSIFGRSALLEPCKYGHDEVVEVLLAAGAEIHFIDADGDTALSVAKEEGHDRIVTLLEGKS